MNKSRIATFSPNWSPGDVILFKLARKAGDVADTIDANDVRVLKIVVSYTGQFAQAFYPLAEPVELTVAASGAWTDINVNSYIPTGATGVILHIENTHTAVRNIGLRKKGSTDTRTDDMATESHLWAMVGVDENRIFQYFVENHNQQKIYIVGYTATGVVFFDNAIEKVPGAFDSWQDIDVSAECPNAIGVIVELTTNASRKASVRKNGSTLDATASIYMHIWAITGCDGAQLFETILKDADVHLYVVGYVTEGAVFKTNAVDETPSEVDVWEEVDCSGDAPSAVMLFFYFNNTGVGGVRKHGSTEDITRSTANAFGFVACDSGQKIDAMSHYLAAANVGIRLFGYATWAGA